MLKTGRTHLQDAVPITLGQEFGGYTANIEHASHQVATASEQLLELNLGATAVGTGLNAGDDYAALAIERLKAYTGYPVRPAANPFRVTQSMGDVLAFSAALRRLAMEVNRIASDLRLLSSGPRAGIAEIQLPSVQPGSSIMPGKVNPSVPEMVNQVCFQVYGCDAAILAASDGGQLELNVMMPVIAWNAIHATRILTNAMRVLQDRCVAGIRADEEQCRSLLDRSTALATALSPYIGYAATAEIAKMSVLTGRPIRDLVRDRQLIPDSQLDEILSADAMTSPGIPGQEHAKKSHHDKPTSPTLAIVVLALALAPALPVAQHTRLFRPEDLSELESPDRDEWQQPGKIMDVLGVGDASVVADLGAGSGWFTIRLAGRVGPNGMVLRRGRPAADDPGDQGPPRSSGPQERHDGARDGRPIRVFRFPSMPCSSSTRITRWSSRSCCSETSRQSSSRWDASASWTSPRMAAVRGRRMEERVDPETVISDAKAGRPRSALAGNVPQVSVHAGVRKAAFMIAAPPLLRRIPGARQRGARSSYRRRRDRSRSLDGLYRFELRRSVCGPC